MVFFISHILHIDEFIFTIVQNPSLLLRLNLAVQTMTLNSRWLSSSGGIKMSAIPVWLGELCPAAGFTFTIPKKCQTCRCYIDTSHVVLSISGSWTITHVSRRMLDCSGSMRSQYIWMRLVMFQEFPNINKVKSGLWTRHDGRDQWWKINNCTL